MIFVQYPPTLTRNFKGYCSQVPCFFTDMAIEEVYEDCEVLEYIRDASLQILQMHKYPSIFHFSIRELGEGIASIHFQIPAWAIEQDSMEPDDSAISYFGVISFVQIDGSISDNL